MNLSIYSYNKKDTNGCEAEGKRLQYLVRLIMEDGELEDGRWRSTTGVEQEAQNSTQLRELRRGSTRG